MRLDAVIDGKIDKPYCLVGYGPEGIGKSSFAAGAPNPIFVGAEKGTAQLYVKRFPAPETWEDILDTVRVLLTGEHGYQTVVYDTLDWIEPLLWKHLCEQNKWASIEDPGYGKGYQAALDEWRRFLSMLEILMEKRRVNVIMLAHAQIRPFKNPAGEDFDRYELKINQKAAGLVKEWAEAVLFANYETFAKEDKKTKRVKGVSTGARLLYTVRTAAFDAKNRYNLPEELPLDWNEFDAAAKAGNSAPIEALREEITRKAKEIGGDTEKIAIEYMEKAGDDAARLAQINNRLNAKIAEKGQ